VTSVGKHKVKEIDMDIAMEDVTNRRRIGEEGEMSENSGSTLGESERKEVIKSCVRSNFDFMSEQLNVIKKTIDIDNLKNYEDLENLLFDLHKVCSK
jgi:hypothetical protein